MKLLQCEFPPSPQPTFQPQPRVSRPDTDTLAQVFTCSYNSGIFMALQLYHSHF